MYTYVNVYVVKDISKHTTIYTPTKWIPRTHKYTQIYINIHVYIYVYMYTCKHMSIYTHILYTNIANMTPSIINNNKETRILIIINTILITIPRHPDLHVIVVGVAGISTSYMT